MKLKKIMAVGLALTAFGGLHATEVTRVEPPFWFTGMKNPRLQLMFYGENIGKKDISLKEYPGVMINGSDTVRLLDMNRFADVTSGYTKGRDVISEEVIDITEPVVIGPRGVYILELSE